LQIADGWLIVNRSTLPLKAAASLTAPACQSEPQSTI
jgi:hypothetical protein